MIQKKVCMLGAFAVGKTSLVKRYVTSIFSEQYHTTVGVKIDKKELVIDGQDVNLVLWDLHGEDEFQKIRLSYLRGMSGYLLVIDGTRRITLDHAITLQKNTEEVFGKIPFILLVNKADIEDEWAIEEAAVSSLHEQGWHVLKTSAKTNSNVEEAFELLAQLMLAKS